MDKNITACGHDDKISYPGKLGDVCTYCARREYIERKKRPFAFTLGLAFLICWLMVPGSLIGLFWYGWGVAWRLFLTGIIGAFTFGLTFSTIITAIQNKAEQLYPDEDSLRRALND